VPKQRTTVPTRSYATEGGAGAKLTLNFSVPHKTICKNRKVDLVTVPGTAGDFGVLPEHVPVIAELRPGVVTINVEAGKEEKYFVAAGFAIVEPESRMTISAVEAVPLADLDSAAARKALDRCQSMLSSAKDDQERARAQIGVDLYSAMLQSI